jgi:hypothetical protein
MTDDQAPEASPAANERTRSSHADKRRFQPELPYKWSHDLAFPGEINMRGDHRKVNDLHESVEWLYLRWIRVPAASAVPIPGTSLFNAAGLSDESHLTGFPMVQLSRQQTSKIGLS